MPFAPKYGVFKVKRGLSPVNIPIVLPSCPRMYLQIAGIHCNLNLHYLGRRNSYPRKIKSYE